MSNLNLKLEEKSIAQKNAFFFSNLDQLQKNILLQKARDVSNARKIKISNFSIKDFMMVGIVIPVTNVKIYMSKKNIGRIPSNLLRIKSDTVFAILKKLQFRKNDIMIPLNYLFSRIILMKGKFVVLAVEKKNMYFYKLIILMEKVQKKGNSMVEVIPSIFISSVLDFLEDIRFFVQTVIMGRESESAPTN